MGNMELFLLGVLAGWIPPLIIVVVLVRRACRWTNKFGVALSKIYLNYTVLMYGIVVALRERSAIDANCHIRGRKKWPL
jgi:hypothetical protein